MRMILAVMVFLVIGVGPHWQKYNDEKIAAYQARHGGDIARSAPEGLKRRALETLV